MKKFIYLFMVLGLVFTACDPMGDIYDEIDAQENIITGEIEFALSDDDYDDLGLGFGTFSSIEDAKTMIPDLLDDKYPVWGKGSLADVSFKLYNPISTPSSVIYALTDEDHNEITGKSYGNFDRDYQIFAYLNATYPNPDKGEFHSLRYRFYAGGETTLTDGFIFENDDWTQIKGFTPEEYSVMGERFPNFSSHDEAALKIPLALPDIYKFSPKEAGDIVQAMYELYKGGGVTKSYVKNYIFDGTSWSTYNNVAEASIKFGHDGTVWVPDNTIKYTLASSDYSFIGDALIDKYPGPGGSASNFGNFDRREGNANYWSDSMLVEGFNILLDDIDSGAAEGQKYNMSFNVYTGTSGVQQLNVIKEGGVWVQN